MRLSGCQPWIEHDNIRTWQEGCLHSEFALAATAWEHRLDVNKLTGLYGRRDVDDWEIKLQHFCVCVCVYARVGV